MGDVKEGSQTKSLMRRHLSEDITCEKVAAATSCGRKVFRQREQQVESFQQEGGRKASVARAQPVGRGALRQVPDHQCPRRL